MQTIVIGHRNPDMDSVCSAVGYAELKRRLDPAGDYRAARAGGLNARIEYVFQRFAVEPPPAVTDVTPQVGDVMTAPAISVLAEATVAVAISSLEEKRLRGLPVTDGEGRCLGLLNANKVTHHLFPPDGQVQNARVVRASLSDITRTFGGLVDTGGCDGELRDYILMVAAMKEASFSHRLEHMPAGNVVVFAGDRDGIQRRAIARRVRAIVATGGLPFLPEIRTLAAAVGVTLLRSPHDTSTTVLQARGAVRVQSMLDREFTAFSPDTPLETARIRAAESHAFAFPVLDAGRRLVGILSKSDFLKDIPRQLILVDHNEMTQAVRGADRLAIVEVLDHHRLGGFATTQPIHFWNNPVGSTSTIVAQLWFQHGETLPAPLAGLLMAGLVSDTLNLTSPTATPTDRTVLARLETLAGVRAADLAGEIFAAGSPLRTLSPREAILVDCKDFDEDGVRFSVAQIEEGGFEAFEEKRDVLAAALEEHRRAGRLFFAALLVTDVNTQNSRLLLAGDDHVAHAIDYPTAAPGVWRLDGVVSRKKQLLPYLTGCLRRALREAA